MDYLHNLLVACDQLMNAVIGGWPDETLSSRCWRWYKDGVRSCAALFGDGSSRSLRHGRCQCGSNPNGWTCS